MQKSGICPLDETEEAVVRALTRAVVVLPRALDGELMRAHRLALHDFEVLLHLSEAPGLRLRMSELAARLDLSLSGTTRVVGRLETGGLVKRVRCEEDARGSNAVLTYDGLKRLLEASPTHLAGVRRHILDHLADVDLTRLAAALQRVGAREDTG